MRHCLAISSLLTCLAAPAATLDFDYVNQAITTEDPMGLGPLQALGAPGWISQSYGDVAGSVDVSYHYLEAGSNSPTSSLMTWGRPGYDDLEYTAWAGSEFAGDHGQISLASVQGSLVSLKSFDLGIWRGGRGAAETVTVFEVGRTDPVFSASFSENSDQHHTFDVHLQSTSGLVIRWTSPYWVAIDNIESSAVAVPEPGTSALIACGLLAVFSRVARRRR